MTTSAASSGKRRPSRIESIRRRRIAVIIGVATILIGLILIPISKISQTDKVSESQTQTAAQSLCPPPIVTSLEPGNCHITIIEHLPNLTASARITVYDENCSIVYQSSMFEEAPYLVKRNYDFAVVNSGIYNITLEKAGVFFVKVDVTITTWKNATTYPFEYFFYSGLTIAAVGLCVVCLSLAIKKREDRRKGSSGSKVYALSICCWSFVLEVISLMILSQRSHSARMNKACAAGVVCTCGGWEG